jgi:polyhydroxybutyrate depolymerase
MKHTQFGSLIVTFAALNACGRTDVNLNSPALAGDTSSAAKEDSFSLSKKCSRQVAPSFTAGFSDHCLSVGGFDRQFRVYVPRKSYNVPAPRAVVFVLHGGGGDNQVASDATESALGIFVPIADRENFIVVYPQGTDDISGKAGWNDCRADDTVKSGADDVAFLSEAITQMRARLNLPQKRFFMSGTSNGAMMTFRFAMEKSALLGGIATSAGNLAATPKQGRCQRGPETPIPVLMTHATDDPFVPFSGGCVAQLIGKSCPRGFVKGATETVQFWLQVNGLSRSRPKVSVIDINKTDGGSAVENKYAGRGVPVTSWILNGAGHQTPSKALDRDNRILGVQNKDIEFAEVAWQFFKTQL